MFSSKSIPPADLYQLIAQPVLSAESIAYIKNLSTQEWNSLIKFTNYNHLSPKLSNQLQSANLLKKVPSSQRLILESKCWDVERRAAAAFNEICCVTDILKSRKIKHCFLKGAAILAGRYDNPEGTRYMKDIDLLVAPGDLDRAFLALESAGYSTELELPLPLKQYWTSKHLPPLSSANRLYQIECHQHPFEHTFRHRSPLTTGQILANHQIRIYNGYSIPIPSPEHIIISAFYHSQIFDLDLIAGRTNYRAINDIVGVVSTTGQAINWKEIDNCAKAAKATSAFAFFLHSTKIKRPTSVEHRPYRFIAHSLLFKAMAITPRLGRIAANTITFCREITRSMSEKGKLQRKILYNANPEEWKYSPIARQLINPSYLRHRLKYLLERR